MGGTQQSKPEDLQLLRTMDLHAHSFGHLKIMPRVRSIDGSCAKLTGTRVWGPPPALLIQVKVKAVCNQLWCKRKWRVCPLRLFLSRYHVISASCRLPWQLRARTRFLKSR